MKKRNPKREQLHFKEIARQVPHFVYWRRHALDDTSDVVTHKEVLTFNRLNINPTMVEYALNQATVNYQCITISYCQSPNGDTYKLYGYAETSTPICAVDEDISPVIYASRAHAESTANTRQIKAHAMVLMPSVKGGPLVYDAVVKLRQHLSLDDRDLNDLHACINDAAIEYEVSSVARDALEKEIAELL